MTESVTFTAIAPVIPVRNLDVALDRYRRLGFTAEAYTGPDRYGYVTRGAVSLHRTEWDEHDPLKTDTAVYLYVSDADALHAEWSKAGVNGRLTDPRDTPYGLREFAFVDEDGTLLRAGSPLHQD